jgi:hypothetical protein
MSVDAIRDIPRPPSPRSRRLLRLLTPFIVFGIVLIAVIGVRTIVADRQASDQAATAAATKTFPTSPTIEDRWGIRFTAVNVLADGGVVEVRYIVLDPAKAGRIHSGKLSDLPYIRADGSGKEVHSYSLMFHAHFDHTPTNVDGRAYSIVFGNSDGAAQMGGTVALILADGLRLEHVPVT